jgi:hypothetical protein
MNHIQLNQLDVLLNADLNKNAASPSAATPHADERLPFTLRTVQNVDELQKAVGIRHEAYARHVPLLAQTLMEPEPIDFEPGIAVMLAESKLNGMALGTMRIQTNRFKPLTLEQSLTLPEWLQGRRLAEATRLGIAGNRAGQVVKTALFKAYYQFCLESGIEWMVIAGRSPIDRQYERLLFEDVYPDAGFIPLKHAGNLPHRVMALRVSDVEPKWKAARHPLYRYFFMTRHLDIQPTPPVRIDPPAHEVPSVVSHTVTDMEEVLV